MMNFSIAILSNSLATVVKNKQVIMMAQNPNTILATEFVMLTQAP